MNNWKKVKLGEIGDIIGGGTPKTSEKNYWGNDISWVTPKDMSNAKSKYISKGERSITKLGLEKSSARLIPEGSVLFTSRAPIGYVGIAKNKISTNQGFKNIVVNSQNNNEFVYYLLKYIKPFIENAAGGTTFKEISGEKIKEIEVDLPILETQKKIASILSSLDKKIELNNKVNEELEKLSKDIYSYWFIQFDFSGGNGKPYKSSGGKMVYNEELKREIPEGWEVNSLSEWIEKDKSGDWGKESLQGNYTEKVSCVRGADLNGLNGKGEIKSPVRFILEKNTHKILENSDLIIEISGGSPTQSTGRLAFITKETTDRFENPLICSNFCKAVTLKNNKALYNFVYQWNLLYDHGVLFGWEGKTSGIKNLLFDSFVTNQKVIKPTPDIMSKFHDKISIFHSKKQKNLKQNQKLMELRDWLLPMLMNGQVRVE